MPWPSSSLFTVRETATSGRGVFATQLIPTGAHLLTCPDLAYGIVFREYRREVCNWCFAYEQGDILPVRENRAALVWCSEECKEEWMREHGQEGVEAYAVVEELARKQAKSVNKDPADKEEPVASGSSTTVDVPREPSLEEVEQAWIKAETQAELIVDARTLPRPSKPQRKAIALALETKLDSMTINHAISGILASKNHPSTWSSVEELYASPQPYNTLDQLNAHTASYLHLLALLPLSLLPHCTREILKTTLNRDAHNSFGIRSLDDDASEMFGYGTWPSASYWNHSCRPNITKSRNGREWTFSTSREVKEGEELCITYLGGEEKEVGVEKRREMLEKAWKFVCGCEKCTEEAGQVDDANRRLE